MLVGLPDTSLSESKDRVRAAIQNSGLKMPDRRVTVNLSPASVRKQGSSFDLAIAVSVMAAAGHLNANSVSDWVHLGELGLDGSVRRVTGILPALLVAKAAGIKAAVVPQANFAEANLVDGITVIAVEHFRQVAKMHGSTSVGEVFKTVGTERVFEPHHGITDSNSFLNLDIADVLGQEDAIEAMVVAAAGGRPDGRGGRRERPRGRSGGGGCTRAGRRRGAAGVNDTEGTEQR